MIVDDVHFEFNLLSAYDIVKFGINLFRELETTRINFDGALFELLVKCKIKYNLFIFELIAYFYLIVFE
jgi:hypothetical protein